MDAIREEITRIERDLERREELAERREEVEAELREYRRRIEPLQSEATDSFNEHMSEILALLEYDNIERIWLEAVSDSEGTQEFNLHIVQSTTDETIYEDTVENLSESEREVTGLVFALAGYLVHDVDESVPFMLLDFIAAIASDRIAKLVAHFADYAEVLVVVLFDEDARALENEYDVLTDI